MKLLIFAAIWSVSTEAQNLQGFGVDQFLANPYGANGNLRNDRFQNSNQGYNFQPNNNPYAANPQLGNNFGQAPFANNPQANPPFVNYQPTNNNNIQLNNYQQYPGAGNQIPVLSPQEKELFCYAERCQACKDNFLDEPILTYDCAGKCSLCTLCLTTDKSVPQCTKWCKAGIVECTKTCLQGKNLCAACGATCGLKLERTSKSK